MNRRRRCRSCESIRCCSRVHRGHRWRDFAHRLDKPVVVSLEPIVDQPALGRFIARRENERLLELVGIGVENDEFRDHSDRRVQEHVAVEDPAAGGAATGEELIGGRSSCLLPVVGNAGPVVEP